MDMGTDVVSNDAATDAPVPTSTPKLSDEQYDAILGLFE